MSIFSSQPQQPTGEYSQVEQQHSIPFYQTGQELGKLMLETNDSNREAYYSLLGFAIQGKKLIKISEPQMNEEGAGNMLRLMHRFNGKDTFLSKIDDPTVVRTMRRIWKELIRSFVMNSKEWALPLDRTQWSIIREIVMHPIEMGLRRAENGVEKEFFKATHESKDVQAVNTNQKFNKPGFFG